MVAHITRTKVRYHILTDEPDNRILECALDAGADFIVTGDKDMLALKEFKYVKIMSLAKFCEVCKTL